MGESKLDDLDSIFDSAVAESDSDEGSSELDSDTDDESVDDVGAENDDESDDTDVSDDNQDSVFDWHSHENELVSVKVSGVDIQVPLGEALNGYLRQQDYTRKTQALSEDRQYIQWAKNLKQAMAEDPHAVVKTLADAYGLRLVGNDDEDEDLDPQSRQLNQSIAQQNAELRRVQAQMEQINQEKILNEVRAEVEGLQRKYSDFDPQVVLPIALETGSTPERAYFEWRGRQATEQAASQAANATKAAEKAARAAAARKASKKVSDGSGFRAESGEDDTKFDSFEDMFAAELVKSKKN